MGFLTSAGARQEIKSDRLPSRMVNNNVLVRMDFIPDNDVLFTTESGFKLILAGGEWSEASRMARFGKVEMVPSFLHDMEWGTEIEVEKGDIIYFGKMASANAPSLEVDGVLYYIIPYSELIAKVVKNGMYPLNGYVLLEKTTGKHEADGLDLSFADFHDKRLGTVRYVGRPNSFYFGTNAIDADVSVGDQVVFEGNYWTELEDSMFAELKEELGFVQRCWVIAKL